MFGVDPLTASHCCAAVSDCDSDIVPTESKTELPSEEPSAQGSESDDQPTSPPFVFREIFAGRARLTEVFKRDKKFKVDKPVEINLGKHVPKAYDILVDSIFKQLLKGSRNPRQLWHFGLPCGSFSILQHSNGGTVVLGEPSVQRAMAHSQGKSLVMNCCVVP